MSWGCLGILVAKIKSDDWRNLPIEKWNVRTVHAYFIEMNRELYDAEYVPMRNWKFEQGVIKRNLKSYGPEVLQKVFDRAFREYRPSRKYPILTAGFVLSYMAGRILPQVLAAEKKTEEQETDISELSSWL
ncbi:hypothetical protein ABNB59_17280 [Paenibacillus larvae]|uniref:Uncharacterized protein n=2 Tax=Paenibacillus larvae TaxID=1464 RepID=A0AAP5N5B4_9BACL|nr:hypothetical protein [Paenibacillus larvae]AQR77229.1 hypothetical protein BXP28_07490 [Paenibacillus larvae subsp. larvae]AVF21810.1 hypothetical protein ERICI_01947 [Paenibacillus larvae subsp. larvae]ETK27495.1 hypothetical protein ERIC1_1c09410 [Paenibacillus larvae subsp. larvae DSM 25719]MCY9564995.1 hypothetical protein [Paenibacillus larvae]MCY9568460.1 hypothetical protein [Paenibacillus larvae]